MGFQLDATVTSSNLPISVMPDAKLAGNAGCIFRIVL